MKTESEFIRCRGAVHITGSHAGTGASLPFSHRTTSLPWGLRP